MMPLHHAFPLPPAPPLLLPPHARCEAATAMRATPSKVIVDVASRKASTYTQCRDAARSHVVINTDESRTV